MQDAVDQFLLASLADGLRPRSIEWYSMHLKPAALLWADSEVQTITRDMVRKHIVTLRSKTARYVDAHQRPELAGGLSEHTIRGRIRALRAFFNWCAHEYGYDPKSNPVNGLRSPRPEKQAPKSIDVDDLVKLLAATEDSVAGLRDRAILTFLADTGCRAGGLLGLLLSDLDMVRRRAMVLEKGKKSRLVYFTPYTAGILEQWLAVRPPSASTLFCSLSPAYSGQQLTHSGLYQIIDRLKSRAGITGRCNPHSFRHAFARLYIQKGGDLASLARLLGHSEVTTTASFYAVFTDDELASQHDKFSPVHVLEERLDQQIS